MNIYTPFTYIIGWSKYKIFYYGAKYGQGCHPNNLWESYFTSSEHVTQFREKNGEPDIIKIHRTFTEAKECVLFEHQYLTRIDAKNNDLFLNKHNGGNKFETVGKISVKDSNGKTFLIEITNEKYITGELIPANKGQNLGTVPCYDINGNFQRISKEQYYSQTGPIETWEWVFNMSNESFIRRGIEVKERPLTNIIVCVDKFGKTHKITKKEYKTQFGDYKDRKYVTCASPEGQKRLGNISFVNPTNNKVSCINKKGEKSLISASEFYNQVGKKENWEWVCISSKEGMKRNCKEYASTKNTVPCINKLGQTKRIPQHQYYTQLGMKEDWEWVHIKSKIGKLRKVI